MLQGFVPDMGHGIAANVLSWHPGHPQKAFWGVTRTEIHEKIPIGAYRCRKCGFLEFYANPEYGAK